MLTLYNLLATPYMFTLPLASDFEAYEQLSFFKRNRINRIELEENVQRRINNRLADIRVEFIRFEVEIKRLKAEVAALQAAKTKATTPVVAEHKNVVKTVLKPAVKATLNDSKIKRP